MGYGTILVDRTDGIATVTLNRPEARNAIDLVMRRELLSVLDELETEAATRVVILTGGGGHFSAGGDVKTMAARRQTAAEGRARVESLNRFVIRLFEYPKPTIAMVDGFAVGAGCNIALGCDVVIASDRARFGEVFARIGLVPDGGGTWLLPRLVGLAKAKELVFSADIIDAAEALRVGLVNRVVPAADFATALDATVERFLALPPTSVRASKLLTARAFDMDLEAFRAAMQAHFEACLASEDHHRAMAALRDRSRA